MKSMTGFGKAISESEQYQVEVEIKSINHRFLYIQLRSPKQLNGFEGAIRQKVKEYLQRGRVEIYLTLAEKGDTEKEVQIHYALQGNDAKQYRLDPDTGKGSITITKADPQTAGMEASSGALQIYNQKAQTYYFPLSTLLPKPSAAEDGTILTLGACTYE